MAEGRGSCGDNSREWTLQRGSCSEMKTGLILHSSSIKIGWVWLVEWSEGRYKAIRRPRCALLGGFSGYFAMVSHCAFYPPTFFFFKFWCRLHDVYILKYLVIYLTALGLHCSTSHCGTWAPECRGSTDLPCVGSQFPDQGSNPCPLHCKANS